MSLNVYLENEDGEELYSRNITHNLTNMAGAAGIYYCLWIPEEFDIIYARQLIDPLEKGVALLATNKSRFEVFNSSNGWGMWEHFLPFCADYLQACRDHPDALIRISR